jgi:hypothetical protein
MGIGEHVHKLAPGNLQHGHVQISITDTDLCWVAWYKQNIKLDQFTNSHPPANKEQDMK